ncbi:MAG: exonuclease SbcCD subunit D, partial [Microbacterium sp.]
MRILHTSDWHIGRSFHGHSTLDALRGVLETLAVQVRDHSVDVVIVAGDVFDSAAPAAACYTLLTDTLTALSDAGAQIVVTSGNHDSAARLGFQSGLLRAGIHIVTDPLSVGTPITIDDAHGPVDFYGIPFLEPALVRHLWPDTQLRSQHATIAHVMDLVRADLGERGRRSVAIAHCFAAGVETTPGVEREIRQGSLDVVPLSAFEGPDYVALGHIHGRQRLSDRVRYAGAPLHYSFGEADKPRGSWLVDLDATGLATVEWLDLPVPRRLVTVRGPLEELLTDGRFAADEDAWVCAQYTDATPQLDPMRRLQSRVAFGAPGW